MYIKLTPEEEQQLQELREQYRGDIEAASNKIKALSGKGEKEKKDRAKALIEYQTARDSLQAAVDSYLDAIQRKRFKGIEAGGTDAVLKHACGQISVLLADISRITAEAEKGSTKKDLEKMGIGTLKDGVLLLNADYAANEIKQELYLHIAALKDNKAALKTLLEAIITAVKESPLTDDTEITEKEPENMNALQFRRSPLTAIKKYGLMNSRATARIIQDTDLFKVEADGQLRMLWTVDQLGASKKEAVPTYISLSYYGEDYKLNKKLNAYDKEIYNAIGTLYYYWNLNNPQQPLFISASEIWRTMNGKEITNGSIKPSPRQLERIRKSINKMRHTDFYMDARAEEKKGMYTINDERVAGGYWKDYLLNCSEVGYYSEKGNIIENGYRINVEPILYTYSRAKKQMLEVPYEMLDTSQYTSDTENVAEFKGYLMQQIELIRKKYRNNNTILIDTIYAATGIQTPEDRLEGKEFANEASKQTVIRRNRKADREKIEGLLEAWKAKGWITDYTPVNAKGEPVKEKQPTKGYKITV